MKILLIESDLSSAREMVQTLEARGIEARVSGDGKEGLEIARADRPDLIVLCVELPRMSGYSVCNKLKKDEALRTIPLVIVSSEATPETFEQHKKLKTRAEGYLIKPFAPEALIEVVGGLVELPPPAVDDAEEVLAFDEVDIEQTASRVIAPEPTGEFAAVDEDIARLDQAFESIATEDARRSTLHVTEPDSEPTLDGLQVPELERLGAEADAALAALEIPDTRPEPPPPPPPPSELGAERTRAAAGHERAVAGLREELAAVQSGRAAAQSELAAAQRDAESARTELASTRAQLAAASAERDHARELLAAAERRATEAQAERDRAGAELAKAQAELQARTSDLGAARTQLSEVSSTLASTKAALASAQALAESGRTDLEATRADLASTRTALAAAQSEAETFRQRTANELQDLQGRLADLSGANARHEERILRAYGKIKADEAVREKARKALAIALQLLDDKPAAAGPGVQPRRE